MKKYILIFVFFTSLCFPQNITVNILNRVFLIKYIAFSGTAFTIEHDNKQYLVSAAHLFEGIAKRDTIQIFHNSQWKNLPVRQIGKVRDSVDIIVFAADIQLSQTFEMPPTMQNMIIGQDIYFLGFPFGITNNVKELNNYFPLPLIKKGIISASFSMGKGSINILYIDGINNKGFSGGPIVFFDNTKKQLKIAGVVSAYRNQFDKVILNGQETPLQAVTNSGFLIGYSIEHAIDEIKKDPNGFNIK